MQVTISVRNLVEFLLRSGDLDNRAGAGGEDAMQEGSRMHREIQKAAGPGYQAEVTLRIAWTYDKRLNGVTGDAADMLEDQALDDADQASGDNTQGEQARADYVHPRAMRPVLDDATVIVEGRADGIYFDQDPQHGPTRKARRRRKGQAAEADGGFVDMEETAEGEDGRQGIWTIDEIKTTYRRLSRIKEPEPVHLAQAMCYAYIYAVQHELPRVNIRMTYVNLYDGGIRYFYSQHTLEDLHRWFADLMEEYRKWAEYMFLWQIRRTASIRDLSFPYPYRDGQKRLVSAVYRTVAAGRKLFLEAPTGTGKTISTLYPAIRAMGEGLSSRIFYLTAKTITRTAAEHAIEEMRGQGLLFKSVVLTARDKICVLEHPDCNPRTCPRAKGHYDRINAALFDLLTHENAYTRENIERYAAMYNVCPFEMGLDVALFSDGIIGDYNYLFDPHAYLRRFFGESGDKKGDYIFLIDEAHNLVDRGRSMYSAELSKEELLLLRREVKGLYEGLERKLMSANRAMLRIRRQMLEAPEETAEDTLHDNAPADVMWPYKEPASAPGTVSGMARGTVSGTTRGTAPGDAPEIAPNDASGDVGGTAAGTTRGTASDTDAPGTATGTALAIRPRGELVKAAGGSEQVGPRAQIARLQEIDQLADTIYALQTELGDILTRERILELNGRFRQDPLHKAKLAVRDDLLQCYFNMNHFLLMLQGLDERYIIYSEIAGDKELRVHLYNADPSARLADCMARGRASVLFSATLLPIQYYKSLLGGTKEDYEIYAQSVFDPARRRLLVIRNVTSRYKSRGALEYERIADCIHAITGERHGNYMVFFPSYAFMRQVADIFEVKYLGRDPATLRDLPVPAWHRPSPFMDGAYVVDEETRGHLAAARREGGSRREGGRGSHGEGGSASLWAEEYGAGTLPAIVNHSVPGSEITLLRQQPGMDEAHREAFLKRFTYVSDEESLLGFCILGGIYSEGIDLRGDQLIGTLIVGTGIPQVTAERDLLKEYFNEQGENGYDYAYRFPGMNKVLQAAGRVIRTQDDVGIIALLDERFVTPRYQSLFPTEWEDYIVTTAADAPGIVARFWDEWL